MVQIKEAKVPCLYVCVGFVDVHVVLDVLEPLKGLCEENVLLNEYSAILV